MNFYALFVAKTRTGKTIQFNAANCRRRWIREAIFTLLLYFQHLFLDAPDCFSFLIIAYLSQ
jgi:hypothetical protein